jgi:hypothetical protein
MLEFAENVQMHDYTINAINRTLFAPTDRIEILPSEYWTSELLDWSNPDNNQICRTMVRDQKGFEVLQGHGTVIDLIRKR